MGANMMLIRPAWATLRMIFSCCITGCTRNARKGIAPDKSMQYRTPMSQWARTRVRARSDAYCISVPASLSGCGRAERSLSGPNIRQSHRSHTEPPWEGLSKHRKGSRGPLPTRESRSLPAIHPAWPAQSHGLNSHSTRVGQSTSSISESELLLTTALVDSIQTTFQLDLHFFFALLLPISYCFRTAPFSLCSPHLSGRR